MPILGPKGSPLQIVLNGLYHMDEMPGKIKWTYYQKVLADPIVQEGIPFCTGHSYAGFRVNAIDRRFLTDFEYLPGRKFSFSPEDGGQGRPFDAGEEAVAGWAVAKELGIKLGQTFNPVCGVSAGPGPQEQHQVRRHPGADRHAARPGDLHPAEHLLHARRPRRGDRPHGRGRAVPRDQRGLPEDQAHPRQRPASRHPGPEVQHQPVHRGPAGRAQRGAAQALRDHRLGGRGVPGHRGAGDGAGHDVPAGGAGLGACASGGGTSP